MKNARTNLTSPATRRLHWPGMGVFSLFGDRFNGWSTGAGLWFKFQMKGTL
jgi:hypothetical protein